MERLTMKKILLTITYTVVLVAVIVKLDIVGGWLRQVITAFEPLYIGFGIAFVLNRPCNFFARHYGRWIKGKWNKLARPLAVITSYVALIAVISALVALVVPELIESIESFVSNLSAYANNLQVWYDGIVDLLHMDSLGDLNLSALINDALGKLFSGVLDTLTNTLPQLISATGRVISVAITVVLSIVFSIYMLFSGPKLVSQFRRLTENYLPAKWVHPVQSVVKLTANTFTQYVSGQLIEACILGCLCFVGMCIFRFSYAPLISVIIAVSALIPIAGAYIGAIVAALLLLMINPMQAIWFLLFLIILQQLEGNLIYPRVVGTSIGLPGIWVLAAVTVGGTLLGFAGLIVGVPITAVLYILLRQDLHSRENGEKNKKEPLE